MPPLAVPAVAGVVVVLEVAGCASFGGGRAPAPRLDMAGSGRHGPAAARRPSRHAAAAAVSVTAGGWCRAYPGGCDAARGVTCAPGW